MTRQEMKKKIMEQTRHNDRVHMSMDSAQAQIKEAQKEQAHHVWVYVLPDTLEDVANSLTAKGYTAIEKENGLEIWGI